MLMTYEFEMSFISSSSLVRHINVVHIEEKPYKCSERDMAFSQDGNLKRHMMTHKDKRSYE